MLDWTRVTLYAEPGPHLVARDVLPQERYDDLLRELPKPDAFEQVDKFKSDLTVADSDNETWRSFERHVVVPQIMPGIIERFRPDLERHFAALFGSVDRAMAEPLVAHPGRLMLRRPGYALEPHRDKLVSAITVLLYLARPGDDPAFGTEIYQVHNDEPANWLKTYYPQRHGATVTLAHTVPFVANTLCAFVNTVGMAHAARLAVDCPQTERYTYQFYIGHERKAFLRLMESC